ncbi:LAMC3 [Cordylochernes scorpioides]|uniref:LAMC3 n=1 Tax=Cordylochernes scorpioides TaxID=51811 RepID=A0ABY6JZX0_9ARAC|nr:LAMC3 [Cordylochernes scorpioides]
MRKNFEISYLRIKFRANRPQMFRVYRRVDGGLWGLYHQFGECSGASRCSEPFAKLAPQVGGSAAFSPMQDMARPPGDLGLREWTTAKDLRISLEKFNTEGKDMSDARTLKSFYFAISDIAIGAR